MIPDGTYTAVVDRIEDGLATLELEDENDLYSMTVDPDALPARSDADAVLTVRVEDSELVAATHEAAETARRTESAQSRFDRLARRPPRSSDPDEESDATASGIDPDARSEADAPEDHDAP